LKTMKTLNELRDKIYNNAKDKGFWDEPRNVGESLMLVVTELAEALEVHRKGDMIKPVDVMVKKAMVEMHDDEFKEHFAVMVKDTFQDEMADSIIRILDLCGGLDIDIDWHIAAKMRYNATRSRLHGKKY
jgi:NTP pyrophosphatase (non-canonical NTP hydrolase)